MVWFSCIFELDPGTFSYLGPWLKWGCFFGFSLCVLTIYPAYLKFCLTMSSVSPSLSLTFILPLPLQTPFMLSNSSSVEMICLTLAFFLTDYSSQFAGSPRRSKSITSPLFLLSYCLIASWPPIVDESIANFFYWWGVLPGILADYFCW